MTHPEALLLKRMAWRQCQPVKPTAADEKYVPIAIEMLTYVGCLNYAMLDLEAELTETGMFRHEIKRRFQHSATLVQQAHGVAYDMLRKVDPRASRQYNDLMDAAYARINECVLLEAPERFYNIVIALCRIIEKLNSQISGRYDFNPAKSLYRIPALLECVKIKDYKIDEIIERTKN